MGLFRVYPTRPTLIPKGETSIDAVADAPTFETTPDSSHHRAAQNPHHGGPSPADITPDNLYTAFSSPTAGLLMCWQYSGSNTKSAAELNRLWKFIKDPDFNSDVAESFSHERERKLIEKYLQDESNPFRADHGWQMSSVPIPLPKEKNKWKSEHDPTIPILDVDGVYHRDITDIIISAFEDDISLTFHMTPFEQYWKVSEERTIGVISEAYSSPEFMDAYQEVNSLPREPGDDLERVVASLMLWSDATHLANFGDASLWPVYLFFGNQSKYTRGKPTAAASHHVAYIPSLPDDFQDVYVNFLAKGPPIVILLACIKFLGECPCPRCHVKKADIPNMGTKSDMNTREQKPRVDTKDRQIKVSKARKYIFKHGVGINSKRVKNILQGESLVPTHVRCVISRKTLLMFDCAIPVFEGLLPAPQNQMVLDLLFDLATWHAYAKLRVHTDDTLAFFDTATTTLSRSVRKFQRTTCAFYHTTELPQEHASRGRCVAALAAKHGQAVAQSGPKRMALNLCTYKYHALADYPNTIRRFGTTDNYTTQTGELEHRRSKRRFPRSGKKKDGMVRSIANQEAIERFIKKVNDARENHAAQNDPPPQRPRTSPSEHYHIAQSSRKSYDLTAWLGERRGDSAFEDFLPRLEDHLLARVRGLAYDGDEHSFSDEDRDCINIRENKIYMHSMFRVNYTTYDLRREQDTVNPRTRADIMVLSHEDEKTHPYWYARVIYVFHVMVEGRENLYSRFSTPVRKNVLFVRWFRRDSNFPSGFTAKRPHRLEYFDQNDPDAFGFVNPDSVIRGVHLIPAFAHGSTQELLGPSCVRRHKETEGWDWDWKSLYVNIFVDRDMFMRFRGGGIGHKATRDWDDILQRDGREAENSNMSEDDSDIEMGEGNEEVENPGEEAEEWEDVEQDGEETGRDNNDDDDDSDDGDDGDEDDVDRVVPDEGEELDDDILAREGYGAL
ncbi:hypothetical protein HYDPIDRAFT_103322 [Hydnomerulius pinastri MD-312]|uniref:Unplaced genomic scaffold scaffold_163, whole genome shotgun sequence n=1 Tax=Hydnomerulius pinastri MD-312 TaxID=994086 RepID=A0A0C9VXN3_9AGAM|nr:hypothetical protein HYDPIDRAFT_103322 [Hydnomerulius pinastri MD-312]